MLEPLDINNNSLPRAMNSGSIVADKATYITNPLTHDLYCESDRCPERDRELCVTKHGTGPVALTVRALPCIHWFPNGTDQHIFLARTQTAGPLNDGGRAVLRKRRHVQAGSLTSTLTRCCPRARSRGFNACFNRTRRRVMERPLRD